MKFLDHEYRDIVTTLTDQHITSSQFHFIKKRGWLYIDIHNTSKTFAFLRKDITVLFDGEFEVDVTYQVRVNDNEWSMRTWDEVLDYLKSWLESISTKG